jgi:dGTPase
VTKTTGSLWSEARLSPGKTVSEEGQGKAGHRSIHEQDYDRILFSTAVRRLSDKTQVFPLDKNDGVRTRLTHSHEVANLGRSIGQRALTLKGDVFGDVDFYRIVAPMLSSSGLAHDLGNPPFGHQGEAAICQWFEKNKAWIFDREKENGDVLSDPVDQAHRAEFLKFDGNPQSIRLLTKLQNSFGGVGLDLSASTIAAGMKYVASSSITKKKNAALKKCGFFHSESETVAWVREQTGLGDSQRHPLAWITEAADDCAYSVLDVEDSIKKGILSPDDLLGILSTTGKIKEIPEVKLLSDKFDSVGEEDRSPLVKRDIKAGYVRSFLIHALVVHATDELLANHAAIWSGKHTSALMDSSELCETLKAIAREYAFGNSEVLRVETRGRFAIDRLLTALWSAIVDREELGDITSRRQSSLSKYVYSLISPNYIEAAKESSCTSGHASRLRYREIRLLTDMISGMTDEFAIALDRDIQSLKQ